VNYLNEPEQVIVRGHGSGVYPAVEQLIHLPRGHGEALSEAWNNLYTELAIAVEVRREGRKAAERPDRNFDSRLWCPRRQIHRSRRRFA
jgi:hypothetical protein